MPLTDFYGRGAEHLRRGVELDQGGNAQGALDAYTTGLTYLLTGIKYEKNNQVARSVRAKASEFMTRAEVLKGIVSGKKRGSKGKGKGRSKGRSKGSSKGSKGKGAGSEDGEDSDEEHVEVDPYVAGLRKQLEDIVLMENPDVSMDDVAGLHDAKRAIEEAVIMPQKFPELFSGSTKRRPWKGILLYGAPGTGKSFLAKAVASEVKATFLSVSSSDIISKWQGESEKLVRELFAMAAEHRPTILFIDEIDSLAGKRKSDDRDATRRVKNELLIRLQAVRDMDGILVLAATNRPMDLDTAVLRRFDKRIYIPLPDEEVRYAMLHIHAGKEAVELSEDEWQAVVAATAGFSGSDISVLVRDALMAPIRTAVRATSFRNATRPDGSRGIEACSDSAPGAFPMSLFDINDPETLIVPPVRVGDFMASLDHVRPSVGEDDLDLLHAWTAKYAPRQRRPSFEASDLDSDSDSDADVITAADFPTPSSSSLAPPPSSSAARLARSGRHRHRKPKPKHGPSPAM